MKLNNLPNNFIASEESYWVEDKGNNEISVVSPGHSDIFIAPGSADNGLHDAATLMMRAPEGDFSFQAKVRVDFSATFDAGVLFIRHDLKTWAKLCFELAPDGCPMVVSVVNKGGTSDDANSFATEQKEIQLRISRKGSVYAFHASLNSTDWIFIRTFSFDRDDNKLQIGFEAQSPNSAGCLVRFRDYSINDTPPADFRDGS